MEITPRELRDIEIHSEIRGYSRDEVNDLLERAALAIEAQNERISQLQDRLTSAQGEAVRTRETEDILHRTLLLAQRAADEAVAEATSKSRQMLEDAELSSRRLVADSEAEARRKGESERRRLEQEIIELAGRRDTLLADVEALTRFESEYRDRMVRALETDLSSLRTRATTAPAGAPEPSDVEIPQPRAAADDAAAGTAAPDAPAAEPAPAPPLPARAPEAGDAPGVSSGPPPSANGDAREAREGRDARDARAATTELDVRTLFEPVAAADAPARTSPPSEPAAAGARAPGTRPIDLASEPVDADILDDDAFFATLRDAVHDDAPLGPRDDDELTGDHQFFDQDADRSGFRDVFRRRR